MLDPILLTILVSLGIFIMGIIFGKMYFWKTDKIIESTIDYLIKNGYLRWKYNDEGEIDIIKLDENDG